ncbi:MULTISPECIES: replication initiator protein A [Asticcacaulis]|jgi:plasmid replication initiation protein|uniref:Plasmid replication initiator protein n=2 Tax=Asticcacaulis TaxID=76890 RepID=A0A3G9G2Y0_9CAUL|nr:MULTISPECIES: replication initiator protein A [Asticcacaulis]MCA1936019.1 replication initiator protein A [Asticcacaulis sp.]MDC7695758.1 replication initiator protein A [Asticcacaulis currens]BBF81692.1 plasmid replication initiator protein [Asticcacaulis excentricus]BEV11727.1 replication initiator protein A [Asticcacaulis sp. DW145]
MARRAAESQFDLFIPLVSDMSLKDQRELMERPFFSLAKRKRLKPIEYTSPDGDTWVKVSGNAEFGIATIWDADIMIWAASVLNRLKEQGVNDLPRTLKTTSYDLLRAIKRDTGGKSYQELNAALQRLESTTIQTSLRAPKRKDKAQFGWIDAFQLEVDPETEAPRGISITLSDWVYQGIVTERSLLTMHQDYFLLTGGMERALYRVARKHAGDQEGGWTCRIAILHEKTGSDSPLKQFTYLLKRIVAKNALPEYEMTLTKTNDGSPAVHFIKRDMEERVRVRDALKTLERQTAEDQRALEIDGLMHKRF